MHSKSVCVCLSVCLFTLTFTPALLAHSQDPKMADDFSGVSNDSNVPSMGSGTRPQPSTGAAPDLSVFSVLKFSGTLTNSDGSPRTGVAGVTFAFYSEQSGGSPLWLETQNVTLDENGRYTVLLGSASSEGLPLEVFSAGEARWLAVQAGLEAEQPRIMLVSVPYAMKALEADRLGGRTADEFVLTEQLEDAVDQQISLDDDTTKSVHDDASGEVGTVGTITADFIPMFADTTHITNSIIRQDTTTSRIGIGMPPNAVAKLRVLHNDSTAVIHGISGVTVTDVVNGYAAGVHGKAVGQNTSGVFGLHKPNSTQVGYGVRGKGEGINSIAGYFHNTAGGKILSGLNASAEVFSVDGSGNLVADGDITSTTGVFSGDGSGLTGVVTVSPSGTTNKLAMFTGTDTIGDSIVTYDSVWNRIGVNQTSPTATLHVESSDGVTFFVKNGLTSGSPLAMKVEAPGPHAVGINVNLTNTTASTTATAIKATTVAVGSTAISGASSNGLGANTGVLGTVTSTNSLTAGVKGEATGSAGTAMGVLGTVSQSSGIAIKAEATNASGTTTGVHASVASASGTAGVFNNTTGSSGGQILSGQDNGTEVFSVEGDGSITTSGYIQLDVEVTSTTPPSGDCDAAAEVGRMKVDDNTKTLYVCVDDAGTIGWGTVSVT